MSCGKKSVSVKKKLLELAFSKVEVDDDDDDTSLLDIYLSLSTAIERGATQDLDNRHHHHTARAVCVPHLFFGPVCVLRVFFSSCVGVSWKCQIQIFVRRQLRQPPRTNVCEKKDDVTHHHQNVVVS